MRLLFFAVSLLLLVAGCSSTPVKMPVEDLEVLHVYKDDIAVLKSDLPPNSREKYEAAKRLRENVDFSFAREVQTLDKIFGTRDARVDRPNAREQMLMFYYQYKNKSIRFCFFRYDNFIVKTEIIEK